MASVMAEEPIRPLVPKRKKTLSPVDEDLAMPAYPEPVELAPPATPRSILKTTDSTGSPGSESSTSTTQSSTSSSSSKSHRHKIVAQHAKNRSTESEVTAASRIKEGAFFAFVLLPLSCWYTRGGSRLKEIDDLDSAPPRLGPSQQMTRTNTVPVNTGRTRNGSVVTPPVPLRSSARGTW